jgi:hypothetical protein
LKDQILSLRGGGGGESVTQQLYQFLFINANKILTQYFIVEPKWENHKLFSINCKNCFTCYIDGRCTSSLINTD